MPKKLKVKTKHPRKPVFDRALETAQKRLVKAKAERVKTADKLASLAAEIPKLENIIRVLGGSSDVGQEWNKVKAQIQALADADKCPHVLAGEEFGYQGGGKCFACTFPNATVEDLPDDGSELLA